MTGFNDRFQQAVDDACVRMEAISIWLVIEDAQRGADLRIARFHEHGPLCVYSVENEQYRHSAKLTAWEADPRTLPYRHIVAA